MSTFSCMAKTARGWSAGGEPGQAGGRARRKAAAWSDGGGAAPARRRPSQGTQLHNLRQLRDSVLSPSVPSPCPQPRGRGRLAQSRRSGRTGCPPCARVGSGPEPGHPPGVEDRACPLPPALQGPSSGICAGPVQRRMTLSGQSSTRTPSEHQRWPELRRPTHSPEGSGPYGGSRTGCGGEGTARSRAPCRHSLASDT